MKVLKEGYQVKIYVPVTKMPLIGRIQAINDKIITVKTIIPIRGQDVFNVNRKDVYLTEQQEKEVSSIEFQKELEKARQELKDRYNIS